MAATAPKQTFRIVSFGCKVNQAEAVDLAARLGDAGLRDAGSEDAADVVIVNTCTVTGEAARQGRQRIRRALRDGAAVVVTGCGAHPAARDASLRHIEGLLLVEPDKDRVAAELARRLDAFLPAAGRAAASAARPPDARSRAVLKVQDGCPASCAYCIVPKVRPAVRSVPPGEAVRQLRELVAAGFGEVVLCGIHLGLYGTDLEPRMGLVDLLERLLAVEGLGRLRLSSIEPMEADARLLGLVASEPQRLCPHLHLPLQSGDDGVLRRMGRPYTSGDFLAKVDQVRAALPRPAVTTDVLVGFPGESRAAFENTLRVCRQAGFSRMHVFPFSRRPGTPAAQMAGQVARAVLRARRASAGALGEELAAAYRESFVGGTAEVAVEEALPDGGAEGVSERYVRVRILGPLPEGAARQGIVPVKVLRAERDALVAEPATGLT